MENNTQQRTVLAQKINQQLEELVKGVDKHRDFLNKLSNAAERFSTLDDQLEALTSALDQYQSDFSGLQQEFSSFYQAQNEQREILENRIRNEKRLHQLIIIAIILSIMSLGLSVKSLLS